MVGSLINNELGKIWKKMAVTQFKLGIVTCYVLGGTEENCKNSIRITGFQAGT
jgi:hypothetical protein